MYRKLSDLDVLYPPKSMDMAQDKTRQDKNFFSSIKKQVMPQAGTSKTWVYPRIYDLF